MLNPRDSTSCQVKRPKHYFKKQKPWTIQYLPLHDGQAQRRASYKPLHPSPKSFPETQEGTRGTRPELPLPGPVEAVPATPIPISLRHHHCPSPTARGPQCPCWVWVPVVPWSHSLQPNPGKEPGCEEMPSLPLNPWRCLSQPAAIPFTSLSVQSSSSSCPS